MMPNRKHGQVTIHTNLSPETVTALVRNFQEDLERPTKYRFDGNDPDCWKMYETIQQIECPTCAGKLGSPVLCQSCLHNRWAIGFLKESTRVSLAKYAHFRRGCGRIATLVLFGGFIFGVVSWTI